MASVWPAGIIRTAAYGVVTPFVTTGTNAEVGLTCSFPADQ